MSEEMVVEQCSPTMAGLKTGNLFSCPAEDAHTLRQSALCPVGSGCCR